MSLNLQLLHRLNEFGVEYVVVGGLAALAHGSTLVTFDIDVCVSFAEPNLSKIWSCIEGIDPRARMRPDKMPIRTLPPNLKNLCLDTDLGVLDLLGEIPGIGGYSEAIARSVPLELGPGLICSVLDLDGMIDSKRACNRDKDRVHLQQLRVIRELQKPPGGPT